MLYELAQNADLSDPDSVMNALGIPADQARALPLAVTALLSRRRVLIAVFVVVDLLIFLVTLPQRVQALAGGP